MGRGVAVFGEGKEVEREKMRLESGYRFLCWEPPTWEDGRSHSLLDKRERKARIRIGTSRGGCPATMHLM